MSQIDDQIHDLKKHAQYKNELKKTYCFCIKRRLPYQSQPDRKIFVGVPDSDTPTNRIATSKYNVFTFLPKNSLAQFSKSSNLYFVLIGVLQILHQITTTEGRPVVYIPLSFIVLISMIKDFFEDYKRHKADNEENSKDIQKFSRGSFEYEQWHTLKIGDIIKVNNKQLLPCDIVLLATSNRKGDCFIETKNLDGETNLKSKYAPIKLSQIYGRLADKDIQSANCVLIEYERQNPFMYRFKGSYTTQDKNKKIVSEKEFFSYENFLERGCSLQNTDWVYGVVVYTGHDTKIMMNSIPGKMKYSKVEKQMSRQIMVVFMFLIGECIFCSLFYNIWYYNEIIRQMQRYESKKYELQEYLHITSNDPEEQPVYNFFLRFAVWFLLLSNCVPISLLVTLETVKFAQGTFIQMDKNYMFNDKNASVHSSNLTEELGTVDFIFSDKTGTLTCNIMKFKAISIFGKMFGNVIKNDSQSFYGKKSHSFQDIDDKQIMIQKNGKSHQSDNMDDKDLNIPITKGISSPNVDFQDTNFLPKLEYELTKHGSGNLFKEFHDQPMTTMLTLLSLCHTVVTENYNDYENLKEIAYNASSPDDLALVSFADEVGGFQYLGKDDDQILSVRIRHTSQIIKYKLLQTIDFTSDRKRMSVIVQEIGDDKKNGRIFLFIKGADNVIIQMLSKEFQDNENKRSLLQQSKRQLQEYATTGLRTLLLGGKCLELDMWLKWKQEYSKAQSIMDDDQLRQSLMGQLEETIESNIELIGVTAIEDKLQDKVGEVIQDLKTAGINVWVLTGDKIETAINIGYSCRLLSEDMTQFIIDGDSEAHVERQLNKVNVWLEQQIRPQPLSIVVAGQALTIINHNQPYKELFLKISLKAKAVMACRVSPKQKQEIVALVKTNLPNKTTLSIGDGANDVSMITEAHVGVGIRGLEGQQAARASDYAIGEFQHLRRLLFYTGSECYRRNSFLILFNFYKNQLFIATYFFYGFMDGFSGQYIYDQWLAQVFNLIFTSLPIIVYALFDERFPSSNYLEVVHTKPNYLETRPDLYNYFLRYPLFTMSSFWRWFFWGFVQSLACLIIGIFTFTPQSPRLGYITDYLEIGSIILAGVITISNFKVLILHYTVKLFQKYNQNYVLFFMVNVLSSLSYFFCLWFVSKYTLFETFNYIHRILHTPSTYVSIILMISVTTLLDVGLNRNAHFRRKLAEKQYMHSQLVEMGVIQRNI